jgi:signal transduction histidine kinase
MNFRAAGVNFRNWTGRASSLMTMFRVVKPHQVAVDLAGAALFCLLLAAIGLRGGMVDPIAVVCMPLALAVRRWSPGLALAVAWIGALGQVFISGSPDTSDIAIPVVLYSTARYGERAVRWVGLASAGLGAVVATVRVLVVPVLLEASNDNGVAVFVGSNIPRLVLIAVIGLVGSFAVLGLSWTVGLLVRTYSRAKESRAAQIEAERSTVIEQERNRIARDMHDVVAHSLAVVIAQADGARYASTLQPESVDTALHTISSTAREALGDVRILLGQLRHSEAEAPQPMLADLDRLVDQMRASGLTVEVSADGAPVTLAAGEQLAIYRIVQEALTNVLRHGSTTEEATVSFGWKAEDVTVTIVSQTLPERPADGNPAGHGLAGMRERAMLWGGTFSAGLEADGRYLVTATLPIRAASL